MDRNQIRRQLEAAVKEVLFNDPDCQIQETTHLVNDLDFDSLDMVDMLIEAEYDLGITIDEEAIKGDKFLVKDILDHLEPLLKDK